MPFTYRLEEDPPVAHIFGHGEVDQSSWVEVIRALCADPQFTPGVPILLDVRQADNAPPPGAAPLIADTWRTLVPGHRVAIVTPPASAAYGVARQVSTLTDGQVEAFDDHAAAVQWLEDIEARRR